MAELAPRVLIEMVRGEIFRLPYRAMPAGMSSAADALTFIFALRDLVDRDRTRICSGVSIRLPPTKIELVHVVREIGRTSTVLFVCVRHVPLSQSRGTSSVSAYRRRARLCPAAPGRRDVDDGAMSPGSSPGFRDHTSARRTIGAVRVKLTKERTRA